MDCNGSAVESAGCRVGDIDPGSNRWRDADRLHLSICAAGTDDEQQKKRRKDRSRSRHGIPSSARNLVRLYSLMQICRVPGGYRQTGSYGEDLSNFRLADNPVLTADRLTRDDESGLSHGTSIMAMTA